MTRNAFEAYKTVGTGTADPVTLTTMLYDGAIKAMKKARIHFESGNRERFLDESGRAHLIVGELLATLNRDAGGELATELAAIYGYCLRCLVGCTTGDMAQLEEAEKHITRIANAWKAATGNLKALPGVPQQAVA